MGQIARDVSSGFQAHFSVVVSRRAGSGRASKRRLVVVPSGAVRRWAPLVTSYSARHVSGAPRPLRVAVGSRGAPSRFSLLCSRLQYTPRLSRPPAPARPSPAPSLPLCLPPSPTSFVNDALGNPPPFSPFFHWRPPPSPPPAAPCRCTWRERPDVARSATMVHGELLAFAALLLLYHGSELALVATYTPEHLSAASLLLSPSYLLAMALALAEHAAERTLVPAYKAQVLAATFGPGLAVTAVGEALRIAAWATARGCFTHRIQHKRRPGHVLITHGVYAWVRHPGYLGWGVWAVGTQLVLGNVAAAVAFAGVSWLFFRRRIRTEEAALVTMFGDEYGTYRRRVPTRMCIP